MDSLPLGGLMLRLQPGSFFVSATSPRLLRSAPAKPDFSPLAELT